MTTKLTFYTTDGCHLCEEAKALLQQLMFECPGRFKIDMTDIVESEILVEQYGVRIPVVKMKSAQKDLGWPFTYVNLCDYVCL